MEEKWNTDEKKIAFLRPADLYKDFYSDKFESLETELSKPFEPLNGDIFPLLYKNARN